MKTASKKTIKALVKVMYVALAENNLEVFKSLAHSVYTEWVNFDSDFARLSIMLSWFIEKERDQIDIQKIKENYMDLSKPVHKSLKDEIKKGTDPFKAIKKELLKLKK